MIHKGIRPKCPVKDLEPIHRSAGTFIYHEYFKDGSIKVWTKRELESGCGFEVKRVKKMRGLIYCPHCDEYFKEEQFDKN